MTAAVGTPALVGTLKCHWCQRWRPRGTVYRLTSRQNMCDDCMDWHVHALEFLGGAEPRGCFQCRLSWEELKARTPGNQVRLYVVPKDGVYQLLCRGCVEPYLKKNTQLFEGTKFGREILKI